MSEGVDRLPGRSMSLPALLQTDRLVVAVECHSVLTARMVQLEGFDATYIGGSTMGALHAGVPDHGLVSTQEMVDHVGRIAGAVDIPVIADGDQGGETALNVRRAVRDFEHAGAAAVHLEDTVNPKHLFDGDRLVEIPVMQARIDAACAARRSSDFLVIARTDERLVGGSLDDVVHRGVAYAEAGADVFMVVAIGRGVDELRAVTEAVPIPVMDINHPVERARDGGLRIDLFANLSIAGVIEAHRGLLREIRDNGRVDLRSRRPDSEYVGQLLDEVTYRDLARGWAELQ